MILRPNHRVQAVVQATVLAQLLLTLSGCGLFTNPKKKTQDVQRTDAAPMEDVRRLTSEDPACLSGGKSVDVSEITIFEWDGSATSPKRVPFKGKPGEDTEFLSANILGSLLDFTKNYNCTNSVDSEACKLDTTVQAPQPTVFNMCRTSGAYGRESLESMTLTSQHFTEAAYSFYDSVAGRKSGIVKSILFPQPLFKRHLTKADGSVVDIYDTNNAAFSNRTLSTTQEKVGAFFIFPTSTKSFDASGLNLWEVPFVMHHEFGHHVLSHYLNDVLSSTSLSLESETSSDAILPSTSRQHPEFYGLSLATNKASQFALDGINETFADLFAYFAGNGAQGQLKGVRCLDGTRDPSSPTTAGGTKKGLDASRVAIFEGREAALPRSTCSEPRFNDEHDIAAALGQPIATFIEDMTPSADGKGRAELLLNWATNLKTLVVIPDRVNLDTLVLELVNAVKKKNPQVAAACAKFKDSITGLPKSTAACAE
jgi:hypothetical protein